MSDANLKRIAVSVPHNIRDVIEAIAKIEGQPVAIIARHMLITAWDVSRQGDTWWTTVIPKGRMDADGEVREAQGPEITVYRHNPIKLSDARQRPSKSPGAGTGRGGRKPAQFRAGASRRKKGSK